MHKHCLMLLLIASSPISHIAISMPMLSLLPSGALATITFGDKQAVTMTTTMTEADFSGKLKGYEAQIVAAFLPKCQ